MLLGHGIKIRLGARGGSLCGGDVFLHSTRVGVYFGILLGLTEKFKLFGSRVPKRAEYLRVPTNVFVQDRDCIAG